MSADHKDKEYAPVVQTEMGTTKGGESVAQDPAKILTPREAFAHRDAQMSFLAHQARMATESHQQR